MTSIRKVLIANRGEIAVRIMRTAKARGVKTVAVYSDADENAFHVRCADEAVHIGGAAPAESYLKIDAIIEAATRSSADAVHPGYGFLSERAGFAEACENAGLVFIGPPAAAIAAMGDKAEAKRRMIAAGVPCVPGYQGDDQSDQRFAKEAAAIGFPLMVKASAGGGGRGMRFADRAEDLKEAVASARKEAESAFGDGRLLLEKAVIGARHVEVQVMADVHGSVIHLGERDCSLQRRRQKVIEEAPSPAVTPEIREAMGAAAVEAARAVGYRGAGTVEFLFDPETDNFYFLEMNTRLQVEHPVTEMVTGLDLVAMQFDVAAGKPLGFGQKDVALSGWAIEARLYAEDAKENFLPQTGRIAALEFAGGAGVRVDSGVEEGDSVTAHYDPMIAKVIAHGATRDEAREGLTAALAETTLFGLTTNAPFLVTLLRDEAFAKGEADTNYIENNLSALTVETPVTAVEIALAAAALCDVPIGGLLTGWNSRGETWFPLKLQYKDECVEAKASILTRTVSVILQEESDTRRLPRRTPGASADSVLDPGFRRNDRGGDGAVESATIELIKITEKTLRYRKDGVIETARIHRGGVMVDLKTKAGTRRFTDLSHAPAGEAGAGADSVLAPMAGVVTKVLAAPGDRVEKGQAVALMEAMKMEHRLAAPRAGIVREIAVSEGDQLAIRAAVMHLEKAE